MANNLGGGSICPHCRWLILAVPSPDAIEVAGLYTLLLCSLALRRRRHLLIALSVGSILLAVDARFWWHERYERKELRVTHLNVGQGDAAVVELPNSQVLLIDAGGTATGDFDVGESIVAPYLRGAENSQGGLCLRQSSTHRSLRRHGRHHQRILAARILVRCRKGANQPVRGSGRCFSPVEDLTSDARRRRLVPASRRGQNLRFDYRAAKRAMTNPLLSGWSTEAPLLVRRAISTSEMKLPFTKSRRAPQRGVKVPRHGNATASSAEFVAAAKPQTRGHLGGRAQPAEAQREEIVERYRRAGADVLRTDEDGAIIVESDGNMLRYLGYKSGKTGIIVLVAEREEMNGETKTCFTAEAKIAGLSISAAEQSCGLGRSNYRMAIDSSFRHSGACQNPVVLDLNRK